MVEILRCCPPQSMSEPYIGVDELCSQDAIFCLEHSSHKNTQGLMHQMLPLKHFKKTLNQKKFKMSEKISVLIDQYNELMDALVEEIRQLKLKKNIQLSMLWLRQLAKDEQQYELMRKVYRSDFSGLTCNNIHSIYFKIIHNQILEKKTVSQIDCYKGMSEVLDHLSQKAQTRSFLSKKIAYIQGLLQNGQILKRALPDKAVLKEHIKQVLLESPNPDSFDIKYNKCSLQKNSKEYLSVFSKYPVIPHLVYHINLQSKYSNVMIGICSKTLKQQSNHHQPNQSFINKHYSKYSLVFNCTNGCIYKDGMFESGSNVLTKGQKSLVLKLRVTDNELLIMMGRHILCRQSIKPLLKYQTQQQRKAHTAVSSSDRLFLHVLLRNKNDSFDVDRDKQVSPDQLRHIHLIDKATAKDGNLQGQQSQQVQPQQHQEDYNNNNLRSDPSSSKQINISSPTMNIINSTPDNNNKPENNKQIKSRSLLRKKTAGVGKDPDFDYDFDQIQQSKSKSKSKISDNSNNSFQIKNTSLPESIPQTSFDTHGGKRISSPKNIPKSQQKDTADKLQKQRMINQMIKKERIAKILSGVKSKPQLTSDYTSEIQKKIQAKRIAINSQKQAQSLAKPKINSSLLKQPLHLKTEQYQKSSFVSYNRSQAIDSPQIKPLLVVKFDKSIMDASKSTIVRQIDNESSIRENMQDKSKNSHLNQNQQNEDSNRLSPTKAKSKDRLIKLNEEESYNFDEFKSSASKQRTPTNKMSEHETDRRNSSHRDSISQRESFTHFSKDGFGIGTSRENFNKPNQKTHKPSNSVDERAELKRYQNAEDESMQKDPYIESNEQSQIIQACDLDGDDEMKMKDISRAKYGATYQTGKMPQLERSRFSKMIQAERYQMSPMQESFGRSPSYRKSTQNSSPSIPSKMQLEQSASSGQVQFNQTKGITRTDRKVDTPSGENSGESKTLFKSSKSINPIERMNFFQEKCNISKNTQQQNNIQQSEQENTEEFEGQPEQSIVIQEISQLPQSQDSTSRFYNRENLYERKLNGVRGINKY